MTNGPNWRKYMNHIKVTSSDNKTTQENWQTMGKWSAERFLDDCCRFSGHHALVFSPEGEFLAEYWNDNTNNCLRNND